MLLFPRSKRSGAHNHGKRKAQLADGVERKPSLSVVVVVYNMPREAPRTLLSLSATYQRHIDAGGPYAESALQGVSRLKWAPNPERDN